MKKSTVIFPLIFFTLILILLLLPTGFEDATQFRDAEKTVVQILETDESRIIDTGIIRSGQQVCKVKILKGKFCGIETEGWNMLSGSLGQDKIFHKGNKAQAVIHYQMIENKNVMLNSIQHPLGILHRFRNKFGMTQDLSGSVNFLSVNLIDFYRLRGELILALLFAVFLIIFAKGTGLRSVISFVLTVLVLWKILVPLFLHGANPVLSGVLVASILCFVIIALVYGFNKKLLCAFCGSMCGILFSVFLSVICTKLFHLHGAVMHNSEQLLYSGFLGLNLTQIFMASVCIGASGSVMDLAVDVTSAVNEVVFHKPDISKKDAVLSGMNVARAAMGTMTTTLLLAYSGSSVCLLMTFMAQGTPLFNILNNNTVAAEILNTIAGSFGLAMTAPCTAFFSGVILTEK